MAIEISIEEQEKSFCSRLRQERESRNLSQLDLSYEAGVSQNMVAYIENGKRTPTLSTILKLCNAMKISPSVLFCCHDDEKEKAKIAVLDLIRKYM